jgi:serine/threonine-protein kinase
VYALATLGYECLCGSPPFDGESAIQVLLKQQSAPIPPLTERAPHVPVALAHLIEKNLSKSPQTRAQDARQFFRDLVAAADPTLAPTLARTHSGHALSLPNVNVNVNVNVNDPPLPAPPVNVNVPVDLPAPPVNVNVPVDLPAHSPSPALIVFLCFLLGITAALGIAHQLGAFDSPATKAGPP